MGKYYSPHQLADMWASAQNILAVRAEVRTGHEIDILSTDVISALIDYQTIKQYDEDFNINLARNGEDGKSNGTHIELKSSQVDGPWTKRGRLRKNAFRDASFMFHALGDIKHDRYIFVARNKADLSIDRLYDIASYENCDKVYQCLLIEKNKWIEKVSLSQKKGKHDPIFIKEEFLIDLFPKTHIPLIIDGVKVFKDW